MRKIFIAGDSTAANKVESARPESGWGEYLSTFVDNTFEVVNFAENGRSAKSFIDLGLLAKIDNQIQTNDILLIQFGHNDQKVEDVSRYTNPNGEYQSYLMNYIGCAIRHHAIPILVSPCTRRKFIDEKTIDPEAVGEYPLKMRKLAAKENVLFIDMFGITQKKLQELGIEESKMYYLHLEKNSHVNYPNGIEDDTHFNPKGAQLIAKMIASELNKLSI